MQMKNANLKNSQKAAIRNDAHNKLMYTVSPTQGYLVKKEYSPNMNADDMQQVEMDITKRISSYIRDNKEYMGTGTDPRIRAIENHEAMIAEMHGAQTQVLHTEMKIIGSPVKKQSQVIRNMELEASRISDSVINGTSIHASDAIKQRTYENLK